MEHIVISAPSEKIEMARNLLGMVLDDHNDVIGTLGTLLVLEILDYKKPEKVLEDVIQTIRNNCVIIAAQRANAPLLKAGHDTAHYVQAMLGPDGSLNSDLRKNAASILGLRKAVEAAKGTDQLSAVMASLVKSCQHITEHTDSAAVTKWMEEAKAKVEETKKAAIAYGQAIQGLERVDQSKITAELTKETHAILDSFTTAGNVNIAPMVCDAPLAPNVPSSDPGLCKQQTEAMQRALTEIHSLPPSEAAPSDA